MDTLAEFQSTNDITPNQNSERSKTYQRQVLGNSNCLFLRRNKIEIVKERKQFDYLLHFTNKFMNKKELQNF
jgi:hypothetical protein